MDSKIVGSLILACGLSVAGYFVGGGLRYFKKADRAVEVKGFAERIVKSTDATWKIDYAITGDDTLKINNEVQKVESEVRKFLTSFGFEEAEIQKSPVNIRDSYADGYSTQNKGPRYRGRGSFIVASKKIDLVTSTSEKTDALIKVGVLVEQSVVNYYFNELNAIKPEMLKEATAAAKEAAASFASNSNSSLGKIKSATQGLFTIQAPFSEYDGNSSIMKKVRVVTQVSYYLDDSI